MATEPAPPPIEAAASRVEALVWEEILRVVAAIRRRELGGGFGLAIRTDPWSGGPELVFEDLDGEPEDLTGLEIAHLMDLVGQNLDVRVKNGRVRVFSPSWRPDEIPF